MTRANLGEECNCGNCPLFESHICKQLGDRMANCEIVLIERVGCLSHPRAREVLMKDVIHEIESNLNPQDRYWKGLMRALDLIRGGVE